VDISADALAIARRNALALGAPVTLTQSNWLESIPKTMQFDLIVSNPPYIHPDDPHLRQGDLRFEPRDALTDQADGLACIRTILSGCNPYLSQGGWVAIEHGFEQADLVLHLMDLTQGSQISTEDQDLINRIKLKTSKNAPIKIVWNKLDQVIEQKTDFEDQLLVSAKTGQGLEQLKNELLKVAGWQPESEGGILARKRHVEALLNAEQLIKNALVLLKSQTSSIELAAEEMRLAQDELSTITGQFLPDDLLGKIFSTFCIGK
jgi:tRNA1(Val) A37 N6-methylase TrmN6